MQDTYQTFHVGINILIVKDDRLLLGKRKNVFGAGTWGLPGGHLETGESLEDAANRELSEETDLQAESFDFSNIVNDRSGNQHRLQIGFTAHQVSGTPIVKEPDKCAEWRWFRLNELPSDLFPPHIKQIENFIQKNYFINA